MNNAELLQQFNIMIYHRASASATAGHSGGARPDDFWYLQEVGYPFWERGSTPDRRTIQQA